MCLPAERRQSFPLSLSTILEGVQSQFLFPPDLSCKDLAEVSNQGWDSGQTDGQSSTSPLLGGQCAGLLLEEKG
jgi:hypothetical protein